MRNCVCCNIDTQKSLKEYKFAYKVDLMYSPLCVECQQTVNTDTIINKIKNIKNDSNKNYTE